MLRGFLYCVTQTDNLVSVYVDLVQIGDHQIEGIGKLYRVVLPRSDGRIEVHYTEVALLRIADLPGRADDYLVRNVHLFGKTALVI